jgi:hypothetical protein
MEDSSIIKPILNAIEYFNKSEKELQHFYKIIDKFCALWFGRPVLISKLKKIELCLIHELLGEFIRFEENNKRIALWLFAVNRVCYNYTADLSSILKEIEATSSIEETIDITLIEQIINTLRKFEDEHITSISLKKGEDNTVGNFLQWIGVYTTYIYPSLENKTDFYDKNMIKAMNFLLYEFIQQKTNDKRLAYLIMAIIEACKQFSLQNKKLHPDFMAEYGINGNIIFAGTEEELVEELLKKLKEENDKQRYKPVLTNDILPDQYVKDIYDKMIDELNIDPDESVSVFNKYTFDMANTLMNFDNEKQLLYLQTLSRYRANAKEDLKDIVYTNLKNSVNLLSSRTKNWIKAELERLDSRKDLYIEYIIQKLSSEQISTKINTAKLFIMLYLINKLYLFKV